MIDNLIVTTKTTKTLEAIRSVRERLNHDSTVLFCQNGMGTVDEINSNLFPEPHSRPQFLAGITSHGVYSTAPFKSVHAGLAHVTIGHTAEKNSSRPDTAKYLISKVIDANILNATEVDPQELLFLQLEKLAVNVILNPLTALLRCKNGDLFTSEKPSVTQLARSLLDETSQVLQSLPETVQDRSRFGRDRLEMRVRDVAEKTAGNTSSMLQDVMAGRETEIDFINGWIVRKGKERGLDVRNNERIVELVKDSFVLPVQEIDSQFKALK
jgi:2-dehydropantoate 2-reductase